MGHLHKLLRARVAGGEGIERDEHRPVRVDGHPVHPANEPPARYHVPIEIDDSRDLEGNFLPTPQVQLKIVAGSELSRPGHHLGDYAGVALRNRLPRRFALALRKPEARQPVAREKKRIAVLGAECAASAAEGLHLFERRDVDLERLEFGDPPDARQGLKPFDVKRVYYLYDVPGGESRGSHAHKELEQLVVAASGSFRVTLDDGKSKRTFYLNRPYQGLFIKPGLWRDLDDFSSGAVCMVLASDVYKAEDYIRDYQEFLRYRGIQ